MSDAEKRAMLERQGFTVAADGRVICKGCGRGAVWLNSAPAGGEAIAGCPSAPPCARPPIPSLPNLPFN